MSEGGPLNGNGSLSPAARKLFEKIAPPSDVKSGIQEVTDRLAKSTPVEVPNVPIPEGVSLDAQGNIVDPERKVLGVNEVGSPGEDINPDDFTFDEEGKIIPKTR